MKTVTRTHVEHCAAIVDGGRLNASFPADSRFRFTRTGPLYVVCAHYFTDDGDPRCRVRNLDDSTTYTLSSSTFVFPADVDRSQTTEITEHSKEIEDLTFTIELRPHDT